MHYLKSGASIKIRTVKRRWMALVFTKHHPQIPKLNLEILLGRLDWLSDGRHEAGLASTPAIITVSYPEMFIEFVNIALIEAERRELYGNGRQSHLDSPLLASFLKGRSPQTSFFLIPTAPSFLFPPPGIILTIVKEVHIRLTFVSHHTPLLVF